MTIKIEINPPEGGTLGGGATNRCCGEVAGVEWSVYVGGYNLNKGFDAPSKYMNVTTIYVHGRFDVVCYAEKADILNAWVSRVRDEFPHGGARSRDHLLGEVLSLVIPWMTSAQVVSVINSAFEPGREQGREDLQKEARRLFNLY